MSLGSFKYTDTYKAPFLKRYDADGTVWIQAIAHGTLVAKTPYAIIANEYGSVSAALSNTAVKAYVGIPHQAAVAGDLVWFQIGGPIADVVTPSLSVALGHAFGVNNGAITDEAADYTGLVSQFAVCTEASTALTVQQMMLVPEQVTFQVT